MMQVAVVVAGRSCGAFRSSVGGIWQPRQVGLAATRACFSSRAGAKDPAAERPVVTSTKNQIRTVRMNNPKRLNAWDQKVLPKCKEAFLEAAQDDDVKALVFTGTGDYFCAGADLSALIKPMMPKALHSMIEKQNYALFDAFISFPKPIFVAVNGHAIGASVTSATLTDMIIASEKATFHVPFYALGVTPEGCSSVLFPKLLGEDVAERLLGKEGWKPTAKEALEVGLIHKVVPHDQLLEAAQAEAEKWVASGRGRAIVENGQVDELRAINARESKDLADAVFSVKFLGAQEAFAKKRKKDSLARFFRGMIVTRPIWSLLL